MKSSAQPKRNITGKLAQTPRVSLRARLTLTGAIVVVATAFVTATASADSINYNLGHQTYTWGDCTLVVGYVQDPNPSLHHGPAGVYGWAAIGGLTINCSSRHASISATVTLKSNGAPLAGSSQSTASSNSYGFGTHVLETTPFCGTAYWQTVANVYISGLGSAFLTSGSPDYVTTGCR